MNLSNVLDTAIGVFFVFALTAGLASVITELIARFLGLRAAYLLQGLRELVGEEGKVDLKEADKSYKAWMDLAKGGTGGSQEKKRAKTTEVLLGTPIMRATGMRGNIDDRTGLILQPRPKEMEGLVAAPKFDGGGGQIWRPLRSLPSYISPRTFAQGVLQMLTYEKGSADDPFKVVATAAGRLPAGGFRDTIETMLVTSDDDLQEFRASLESWYDDHMDRVSGWYKRRTGKIAVAVGAALVVILNIDGVAIAKALYVDSDLRSAVVAEAIDSDICPDPAAGGDPGQADLQACLDNYRSALAGALQSGLPIGWSGDRFAQVSGDTGLFLLSLLGWSLTILALVPGARFWFDMVGKAGSLRSTGPKPRPSQE